MLTYEMKKLISEHRAGMVASINDNGTPSVSPKATFVILDDETLAFGNLRSPKTIKNINQRPNTEVCFIDVLARKALRVTGTAKHLKNEEITDALRAAFEEIWADFLDRFSGVVEIKVTAVEHILSPAYDMGITEGELREASLAHLKSLS